VVSGHRRHELQGLRGDSLSFPNLLTNAPDSCLLGTFAPTTTGTFADVTLPPGYCEWFLVTGVNGQGEGTAGNGTAGAQILNPTGACVPRLVINEVDYDQVGTDTTEFIEIFNPSLVPQPLSELRLVLINGTGMSEYQRANLSSGPPYLQPGEYLVVADIAVNVAPGADVIRFMAASDNVQNGAPDGIALWNTATNTLIDALSYEGSITNAFISGAPGPVNLVEGTATSAADTNSFTASLVRLPNGSDTNNAQSDWALSMTPTPGSANLP
jgi:hypothetical protein